MEIDTEYFELEFEGEVGLFEAYLQDMEAFWNFPSDSPEWKEIQNIRRLRNCIVHNQGKCSGDKYKDLKDYIAQNSVTLSLYGDEIVLSRKYCEQALRAVGKFIQRLSAGNRPPSNANGA
jgi:hypothetical protein